MEGQAEAVAAQGQYQLLTLLQKAELATVLLCSGPTSVRTNDSDPDGSVPQGMSHYTKAQFSRPGQRETAGRRKIIVNPHRHSPKERDPERPLTPSEKTHPHGHRQAAPETPPYLLVTRAQARRGPHSRLVIAGILAVVLHLRLGQAAAQGTHPISPAEASEAKLALSTLPRAPSLVPLPQDKLGGW